MRSLGRWLLVIALSLSIGLQWAVVQSAAWVGMFVNYSKEATISQSLARTFDGKHPCKLCEVAQRGESNQDRQNTSNSPVKLNLAAPEQDGFLIELVGQTPVQFAAAIDGRLGAKPAVPPPKTA
ncbi:MAG TPA: hypothetical protein VGH65_05000 [Verrucomicrobiaceae bacterium]|jgi:hypothetical protein